MSFKWFSKHVSKFAIGFSAVAAVASTAIFTLPATIPTVICTALYALAAGCLGVAGVSLMTDYVYTTGYKDAEEDKHNEEEDAIEDEEYKDLCNDIKNTPNKKSLTFEQIAVKLENVSLALKEQENKSNKLTTAVATVTNSLNNHMVASARTQNNTSQRVSDVETSIGSLSRGNSFSDEAQQHTFFGGNSPPSSPAQNDTQYAQARRGPSARFS